MKRQTSDADNEASSTPLVYVSNLTKWFPIRRGLFSRVSQFARAVDGVSFEIFKGQTLGLVGESGCGKTTVGRSMLRLIQPTGGEVVFKGRSVLDLPSRQLQELRREMQIVFQDPYGSLNPRMTIGATVAEPLVIHRVARGRKLRERVAELLDQVGLNGDAINRYPHEFSGGQRQRVGIARAIALNPEFIVCDEPTSALDVTIRAQIIKLLEYLQEQFGLAYLMISHDLAAVRHISHAIAVMYLGRIVEQGPTEEIFAEPRHPYTRMLFRAIPVPDPTRRRPFNLDVNDDIPSPINIPSGCPFHPRCPLYTAKQQPERCRVEIPVLRPVAGATWGAACHYAEESGEKGL